MIPNQKEISRASKGELLLVYMEGLSYSRIIGPSFITAFHCA